MVKRKRNLNEESSNGQADGQITHNLMHKIRITFKYVINYV